MYKYIRYNRKAYYIYMLIHLNEALVINHLLTNKSNMKNDLQNELRNLFNAVKVQKNKDAGVDRSSLISLFQYHEMDTQMPQFYRYLCRSLDKLPDPIIKEEDFLKIALNPDINLGTADKQEMADAFSILDVDKVGSIDLSKFLELYRQSENYQCLNQSQKKQVEDQIKQAFYNASQDGRLTPMDFYSIIKFRST